MLKKNIFLFTVILVAILVAIGFYFYKKTNLSTNQEIADIETNIIPKTDAEVEGELKEAIKVKPKSDIEIQKSLQSAPKKDISVKTDEEVSSELKQFK